MGYNPPPVSQLSNFMTVRTVRTGGLVPQARAAVRGPFSLDVVSSAPRPPIGTVNPGELMVDAQYKTIWLGVDASVDVTQTLLLCDMAALLGVDDSLLAEAKAYTDAQVALRALLKHSHTHDEIVDWEQAINAAILASAANWQRGMIQMFSGNAANIGFDWSAPGHSPAGVNLLGWALCNGDNGTPDLKDKFVIGAGNKSIGVANPAPGGTVKSTTNPSGAHSHGGFTENHNLGVNELPPHTHAINEHHHKMDNLGAKAVRTLVVNANAAITQDFTFWQGNADPVTSDSTPALNSTVVNTTTNNPHRHTIFAEGGHTHELPGDFYNTGLPWYSLAYIMKL